MKFRDLKIIGALALSSAKEANQVYITVVNTPAGVLFFDSF